MEEKLTPDLDEADLDEIDKLVNELIACPEEQWTGWIATVRDQLTLPLFHRLQAYSTVQYTLSEPKKVERFTRLAMILAEQMSGEPLALPVACWARGNWAMFYAPHDAIDLYRRALAGHRLHGDALSVARLLANLVGVLTECGHFAEAEEAYADARAHLLSRSDIQPIYRLRLEQNYGWLLHCQGRYAQALRVYEQTLELAEHEGLATIVAEIQINQTLALGMLGRVAEGEAILLQQRQSAWQHEQWLTVARVDMNLGELYAALGRPAAALHRFQQARQQFAVLDNTMEVASVQMREGILLQRIGGWRAARRSYVEAQQEFSRLQMWPQVAQALVYAAMSCRHSGDYEQCLPLLQEAENLWRKLEQPLWLTLIQLERIALALDQDPAAVQNLLDTPLQVRGNPYLDAQHDLLEAIWWRTSSGQANARHNARRRGRIACQRALVYAESQGDRWLQRKALIELGNLCAADAVEKAFAHFEQAAALDEQFRRALTVEELKADFLQAHAMDLFSPLIRLAVAQGLPLRALSYVWQFKAHGLLDLMQVMRDAARGTGHAQDALEQTRQELATQRWMLSMESNLEMPDYLRERNSGVIQSLENRLQDLRRQRNQPEATYAVDLFAEPERALARLPADALLEYVLCEDQILGIYADSAGNCRSIWLCAAESVLDLLADLQLSLHHVVSQPLDHAGQQRNAQWQEELLPLLADCYNLLIAPFPEVRAGAHLLIAPCDLLHQMPFAALWDGQSYLIEEHVIELVPSGGFLALPPASDIATGAPVVIAASASGQMANVRHEAEAVAARLPDSVVFIDKPHVLSYLAQQPLAPKVLHIAAHSLMREDAPLFSALQLTEESLSVEQCYELNLAGTELVVLSGCRMVAGMDTGGALLAFQSACFVAGAKQVLSTLWPIQDEASARWMSRFYHFYGRERHVPLHAWRLTLCELLEDPLYGHPAFWAAFVCSRR